MTHLANLPIAAADAALADELLQKIRRHGYEGQVVDSLDAACAAARQGQPDAMLVADVAGADGLTLAKTLKTLPGCAEIPICLIARDGSPALKAEALAAGIDDVLSPPVDEGKLIARLRPLVRLATMCEELHQRAAAARRFGVDVASAPPSVAAGGGYRLLLVGQPRDGQLGDALAEAQITRAASAAEAEALLPENHFDAVLLLAEDDLAPAFGLCAQIRNNPRLFNLPVLLIASAGTIGEGTAYQNGVTAVFAPALDPAELKTRLLSLVRRQRLRWAIRRVLGQTLAGPTRDPATGIYNRAFLDAYLSARVAYAGTHGHPLSLMFFRVPDIDGVRRQFGPAQADHLRLQVAQWITGLLRSEDLTGRYDENEFCVVLPDTPWDEAAVVMHRIAGVLAYTDFAVKEVYQPIKVWVRGGGSAFSPGDDLAGLIARARQDILPGGP